MTNSDTTIHECGLSAQSIDWVKEHGSAFLRFCVAEGAFCVRFYNEERVQKEAPGWSILYGAAYQPDHPPAGTMELLARAREQFPNARLRQIYVCADRDEDEYAEIVKFVVVVDEPWPDGQKLVFNDIIVVEKD